ncbi:hypothetical protein ACTHOQ_13315 [Solibacillus silvestris]|uniref:hypothetical protein n=1 Tax=Solibacillus silvestris TaxID=76853 RepID=UPI003F81E654
MKRKILFALIGALLLHILYFAAQILFGIMQTLLYRPQFAPNVEVLQSEITFGVITRESPMLLFGSYLVVALLLFGLLILKKERREHT